MHSTVSVLVYKVEFVFGEAQPPGRMLLLWNIFQQYAWKNDAVPEGKVALEGGRGLTVRLGTKRRLGLPKNETP